MEYSDSVTMWRGICDLEVRDAHIKLPLVLTIIDMESSGEQTAWRYEPLAGTYNVPLHSKLFKIEEQQETAQQQCSWGLMQVLGSTARELDYNRRYMADLCAYPALAIRYGVIYLKHLWNMGLERPDQLFSAYNGGPSAVGQSIKEHRNRSYVEKAMETMSQYVDGVE